MRKVLTAGPKPGGGVHYRGKACRDGGGKDRLAGVGGRHLKI